MTTSLRTLVERKSIEGFTKLTHFAVDPHAVVIEEGWNGRDDNERLKEHRAALKAAMKAGAFIPPIDVEIVDGQAIVRDGHSRTLMARELVTEGTPYVLQARQISGNDADMIYHMIGTASGLELTPVEVGRQLQVLVRHGETAAAIAARLGKARQTVDNLLKMAEMPAAVQRQVAEGKVSSNTALKVVKAHGKEAAKVIAAAKTGKSGKVMPKAVSLPAAEVKVWIGAAHVPAASVASIMTRLVELDGKPTSVAALIRDARAVLGLK